MQNPFKKKQIEHNCDWELISKTYAAPIGSIPTTDMPDQVLEKALMGVTTMFFKCQICQTFLKEEVLGSDENQVENLLDKVDAMGPQYLYKGTETYMIGLVPKEEVLPVR